MLGALVEERASELKAKERLVLSSELRALGEALMGERAELVEQFRAASFDAERWKHEIRRSLAPP